MNTKKTVFSLMAVILFLSLVFGGYYVIDELSPDNAFEEMYQSIKYPRLADTSFTYMLGVEGFTPPEHGYNPFSDYSPTSVDPTPYLSIDVNLREGNITIVSGYIVTDDAWLHFNYTYNVRAKTLVIAPLSMFDLNSDSRLDVFEDDGQMLSAFLHEHQVSREAIEQHRNHVLYQQVLSNWVTGNGYRSRFSNGDLGEFEVVDNTFLFLGGDWR